ncbi:MAG: BamA/TamA family outer membrane protein [Tannerella sp.]|jgi:outer membrane protein assembly factor BamA|nr:BamA/TamA family outer membrane protein [Tannerella sp.]
MALLFSCNTTKFVGDGEYLLGKAKIRTDNKDVTPYELTPYLQQRPNYRVFGFWKMPLHIYNLSGRNDNKWINRQLRSMGEAPVIFDFDLTEQSKDRIEQYLSNSGYANAQVNFSIDTARRKKAAVNYSVATGIPYRIYNYRTHIADYKIDSILQLKPQARTFMQMIFGVDNKDYTSLIKPEMLFDRMILNKERQRITSLLRRNGYYAFNRDNIEYKADTSFNSYRVDLDMYVKPLETAVSSGDTVNNYNKRYYINSVKILTDYDPLNPEKTGDDYRISDSTRWRGVNIYYGQNGRSIHPKVLQQGCYIVPGRLYNERNVEQTYESFSAMGALRYVTVRFDEFEDSDTMKLDCTILTAPAKKQGVYFDVEGTNSAGDLGFASSLTYQHRNLFKGSELFSAKIRGGYEYLSATEQLGNYWEYAGETSLHFPHFVFPFVSYGFKRRIRATTEFKMSYDQQQRPEYHRSIVSGSWIYHWQNRNNMMGRHTFKLLDVNYVFLPYIDNDFKEQLPETTTLYNYTNQFVVSTGYAYSFNNYDPMEHGKNTYSYRMSLESAGNVLYALSNLLGAKKDGNGRYNLFGINYSQFLKGDLDFARSYSLDERNNVAFHIGIGVAYPFGNTKEIPFDRRYYAGGANSNRGWNVRTLGPGSMPITDSTSFINQVGDIRLDANLEYRTKLFWKFELALFADAGNIWTIRKYDYQPQGNFNFGRFYREIALSYGLGLRLDFDYFLVRFDTGMKAYNPQEPDNKRWVIGNPNFRDNFAWHFAVGYPF